MQWQNRETENVTVISLVRTWFSSRRDKTHRSALQKWFENLVLPLGCNSTEMLWRVTYKLHTNWYPKLDHRLPKKPKRGLNNGPISFQCNLMNMHPSYTSLAYRKLAQRHIYLLAVVWPYSPILHLKAAQLPSSAQFQNWQTKAAMWN